MGLVYIAGYIIRKDEREEDSTVFSEKYGDFVQSLNREGLSLLGDSVCQWVIFCYMVFHKVASESCRRSLSKLLLSISDSNSFNMIENHARVLSNIFFNNYCHLYSPRFSKETNQKIIKLSVA